MYVLIDETGPLESEQIGSIGLVTLVTITDSQAVNFIDFIKRLYPARVAGVKGSNIDLEGRKEVLRYIGQHQEIKYTTLVFDMAESELGSVLLHQKGQIAKIEAALDRQKAELMPSYLRDAYLLRDQIRGLSRVDYIKFQLINGCLDNWQRCFLFDYVDTYPPRDTWDMRIRLDTQNKPERFQRILKSFIMLTRSHLNPNYASFSPAEWRDTGHPFEEKYGTIHDGRHAINGKVLYQDFKIVTEEQEPLLLLPDLIGHTILRSILNRDQVLWLKLLKKLKPNRSISLSLRTGNDYYIIEGFNQNRDHKDVSAAMREHYHLMKRT